MQRSTPAIAGFDPRCVREAAERIATKVRNTPVLECPDLDREAGVKLWLKAENLQRIGAFKARGAMHAAGRFDEAVRRRGLITYSSGNHAQAVALAAKTFGVSATITMPTDAPAIKVASVRQLGAEVVFAGTTSDERKSVAMELQARTGAAVIPPFDDIDIIAGAGTATLELLEHVAANTNGQPLDALFVPVGGGGLIAGACLACAATGTKIFAVEPYGCDSMAQSIAHGELTAVSPAPTIADGLKPVTVGAKNFAIAKERVHACLHIDDDAMGYALARLLIRGKVLVEPSGAAALAAALRHDYGPEVRNVGVMLSGGNVDPSIVGALIAQHGDRA